MTENTNQGSKQGEDIFLNNPNAGAETSSAGAELSREQINRDIADMLEIQPEELDADSALTDQGLDSLRLMTLVEGWRADGHDVDFHQLLAAETLTDWYSILGV